MDTIEAAAREYLTHKGDGGDALADARERLASAALPLALNLTRSYVHQRRIPGSLIEADSVAGMALAKTIQQYRDTRGTFRGLLTLTIRSIIIDDLRVATTWDRVRKCARRPDRVSVEALQPSDGRPMTFRARRPHRNRWAEDAVAGLFRLPLNARQRDVLRVLLQVGGSQAAAAKAMGVTPSYMCMLVCQIRKIKATTPLRSET